ncbi:MAG TPA: DUF2344 domain-containing protein, partial [Firmicutes bacterium]|nr:DUF2344 domain-containing protein [Bacillota bacterium]
LYSQGFNPQPRLVFSPPLPVGITGTGEYLDIWLEKEVNIAEMTHALNGTLPSGIKVIAAKAVSDDRRFLPLPGVNLFLYSVDLEMTEKDKAGAAVETIRQGRKFPGRKKTKQGYKEIDFQPYIMDLALSEKGEGLALKMFVAFNEKGTVRPDDVLTAMGISPDGKLIKREEIFFRQGNRLRTPMEP